ncbi:uncharacterized protein LOC136030891 [Artemia franciscana]|uniref:uncharacterized protein LOC136030891 n=1 Tax=Artemia franciscana TaxID=6661 RepID=UPI0032DABF14
MIDQCKTALPQTSEWPPFPAPVKPLNRVFIIGPAPEKTKFCSNQKQFIEDFIIPAHVQKIHQTKFGLVAYIKTESASQVLVESLFKMPDIKVKYQIEKFMAVAKFVPPGSTPEEITPMSQKLKDISLHRHFADALSTDRAIRQGIFVEYTHLKVTTFKEISKRRFRCQSFKHLARDCSNQPCYPRCAGPNESTKETPCQSNNVECALCPNGKSDHPSYSLIFPAVKKAMNKACQPPKMNNLKVFCRNIYGHNAVKIGNLNGICYDYNVICAQEHLLTKQNFVLFQSFPRKSVFIHEAKQQFTLGRPSGGAAVIVDDHIPC